MTYSKLGTDTKTGGVVNIFKLSRLLGLYIIGLQGMGKSGLLEELILADIKQEIGVCVLDPHGELVDNIIARLPDSQKEERVIYLDLAESQYYFGLNLLACPDLTSERKIAETRSQVLHVFEKAFGINPSTPLMYDLLHRVSSVLIANPGYTMVDISLFLTNEICRKMLVQGIARADIRGFWERWDDSKLKSAKDREEDSRTILNKLNDFEDEPLRYIVGQSVSTIDLQRIMDEGKILLVKLDRRLERATKLVGSIIVALILTASASRQKHGQFHLYADEFQNFATEDFAVLLEEARKSGIGITMAHQNRSQLELSDAQADKNLKARTLNVGNLVVFRVPTDAESLAGQFDVTPQAAWEEEIEPEKIKVIRPQWHERKEEVVDDGIEEIKTPATDPVEFLLERGGHPDSTVMAFVNTYLRKIVTAAKSSGQEVDSRYKKDMMGISYYSGGNYVPNSVGMFIPGFRSFLGQVIGSNNPLLPFPPNIFNISNLVAAAGSGAAELFGFTHIFDAFYVNYRDTEILIQSAKSAISNLCNSYDGHLTISAYERTQAITGIANLFAALLVSSHTTMPYFSGKATPSTTLLRQVGPNEIKSYKEPDEYIVSVWGSIEKYKNEVYDPTSRLGRMIVEAMEHELEQAEAFFVSLRAFLKGLIAQPILTNSGQYQPRKRTQVTYISHESEKITIPRKTILHPQRSYDDVKGERANELVRLPRFTARVKLSDGSGNAVEHTIQTYPPGRGLYGQALIERKERIRQNNIHDGYLKDRAAVEAEILNRQIQYSQQVLQQPQAQQIPLAARKAIPCSSCGFSNRQGTYFCNQCGAKL